MKPKWHHKRHLARQFARDGLVLDTFPIERDHKVPLAFAELQDNTTSFEKAVLVRTLAENKECLKTFSELSGLRGRGQTINRT